MRTRWAPFLGPFRRAHLFPHPFSRYQMDSIKQQQQQQPAPTCTNIYCQDYMRKMKKLTNSCLRGDTPQLALNKVLDRYPKAMHLVLLPNINVFVGVVKKEMYVCA